MIVVLVSIPTKQNNKAVKTAHQGNTRAAQVQARAIAAPRANAGPGLDNHPRRQRATRAIRDNTKIKQDNSRAMAVRKGNTKIKQEKNRARNVPKAKRRRGLPPQEQVKQVRA